MLVRTKTTLVPTTALAAFDAIIISIFSGAERVYSMKLSFLSPFHAPILFLSRESMQNYRYSVNHINRNVVLGFLTFSCSRCSHAQFPRLS